MSVLVVAQSSSEIPEGLLNNPVHLLNDSFGESFIFGSFMSGLVTQTRDPFCIWDLMESRERSLLKVASCKTKLITVAQN